MAGKGRPFTQGDSRAGRPAGTPNKVGADVKAAILEAFELAGGVQYLLRVAQSDPRVFCALLSRVLPMQVAADGEGPVRTVNVVKFYENEAELAKSLEAKRDAPI